MESYLHTDEERKLIPSRFIHLRKDGRVIHKDPRAFLPRHKNVALFDEETGQPKLDENGEQVYKRKEIPPANDLKANYLDKGWAKCKIDGSDLPGPKVKENK